MNTNIDLSQVMRDFACRRSVSPRASSEPSECSDDEVCNDSLHRSQPASDLLRNFIVLDDNSDESSENIGRYFRAATDTLRWISTSDLVALNRGIANCLPLCVPLEINATSAIRTAFNVIFGNRHRNLFPYNSSWLLRLAASVAAIGVPLSMIQRPSSLRTLLVVVGALFALRGVLFAANLFVMLANRHFVFPSLIRGIAALQLCRRFLEEERSLSFHSVCESVNESTESRQRLKSTLLAAARVAQEISTLLMSPADRQSHSVELAFEQSCVDVLVDTVFSRCRSAMLKAALGTLEAEVRMRDEAVESLSVRYQLTWVASRNTIALACVVNESLPLLRELVGLISTMREEFSTLLSWAKPHNQSREVHSGASVSLDDAIRASRCHIAGKLAKDITVEIERCNHPTVTQPTDLFRDVALKVQRLQALWGIILQDKNNSGGVTAEYSPAPEVGMPLTSVGECNANASEDAPLEVVNCSSVLLEAQGTDLPLKPDTDSSDAMRQRLPRTFVPRRQLNASDVFEHGDE